MRKIESAGAFELPAGGDAKYREELRVETMSLGTYCISAGAADPQKPHLEDEIYVVVAGRGLFTGGGQTVSVEPGAVLFVPAHEEHRFHDLAEDLSVLVVFSPPHVTS
jgi:mannose-6-phosphate isomerase-like protein (cupin superfamily)